MRSDLSECLIHTIGSLSSCGRSGRSGFATVDLAIAVGFSFVLSVLRYLLVSDRSSRGFLELFTRPP